MKRKHTHIGAYGIITNNNCIALIKKARGGYTGKLDLPGGGIEHNETPTETLIREIMEEVHAKVINYQLLDAISTNITWQIKDDYYEDLHHIGILYLVNIKNNQISQEADGIDSLGAAWYEIDKLDMNNLSPFAKYAIAYLKKQ